MPVPDFTVGPEASRRKTEYYAGGSIPRLDPRDYHTADPATPGSRNALLCAQNGKPGNPTLLRLEGLPPRYPWSIAHPAPSLVQIKVAYKILLGNELWLMKTGPEGRLSCIDPTRAGEPTFEGDIEIGICNTHEYPVWYVLDCVLRNIAEHTRCWPLRGYGNGRSRFAWVCLANNALISERLSTHNWGWIRRAVGFGGWYFMVYIIELEPDRVVGWTLP